MSEKISPNTTLSHYRIVSKIGAGGMGEVYLADDTRLRRRVALKVLPESIAADSDRLRRFEREAFAASSLNHPNILTIFEFGTVGETHFLASEFVDGESLRERMRRTTMTVMETLEIATQITSALQAAHDAGIVHRDIKPDNVMIRADGYIKVLDFGLAKLVDQPAVSSETDSSEEATLMELRTQAGIIMGTVEYMSPEQARGHAVDKRTDIWSLGCVLYEMLTGQPPFRGDTASDTLANIINREPVSILDLRHEANTELQRIINKMLCKKRDDRYQTAKELLGDLKQLQKRLEFEAELGRSSISTEGDTQVFPIATGRQTQPRNSIAVLPFSNISPDPANEYFCDGLAEELLSGLAKIDDLKVAARTSAFSFKGKDINVKEIGNTLNVRTVLEGSVRKSGKRVRITVQLINVADGYHLWSESYDREMRDIFDVQDEITLAVIDALKMKLLGPEKAAIFKHYTENTEAHESYLKGLYYFNQWSGGEGWLKSIECFEKAIELEPRYAAAWAGIANSYHFLSHVGLVAPTEIIEKWRAAACRAIELDDELPEAHWAMADIYYFYDWNWVEAEAQYKRAIELNSNSAFAHLYYGLFLATMGRSDDALNEARSALELDPLSTHVNFIAGATYLFMGRLDKALACVRSISQLASDNHLAHWLAGDILSAQGKHGEAIQRFENASALGSTQNTLSHLGCVYGLAGRRDDALGVLNRLLEMRERKYATAFNIARVYAGLGETDKAFEWLGKAVDERDGELVFLNGFVQVGSKESWGKMFYADSRFKDLLRRMRLAE